LNALILNKDVKCSMGFSYIEKLIALTYLIVYYDVCHNIDIVLVPHALC